jgi:hypothetical protein
MRKVFNLVLLLGMVSFFVMPARPALAGAVYGEPPPNAEKLPPLPEAIDAEDDFGYKVNPQDIDPGFWPHDLVDEPLHPLADDPPYWVLTNLTPVTFPFGMYGDAVSVEIPFVDPACASPCNDPDRRFSFSFYENTYDSVLVSMNGVLRFNTANPAGESDFKNYPLPTGDIRPAAPTNMIAPFWADFEVDPTTTVKMRYFSGLFPYYLNQALVIQWENLTLEGVTGFFSFGVALQSNGDIFFLIKSMPELPDELTIGIQNLEGEDGLTFHFNGSPVLTALKVHYIRKPSPDYHVKAKPGIQGAFTEAGAARFSIQVINSTDLDDDPPGSTTDFYFLSYEVNGIPCVGSPPNLPCWDVQFYTGDWRSKLPLGVDPFDGKQKPYTSSVVKGGSYTVNLLVTAPSTAQPGDQVEIQVLADSSKSTRQAATIVQVAVPTAFVDAYVDNNGAHAGLIGPYNQNSQRINAATTNTVALADWADGFVYTWADPLLTVSYAYYDEMGFLVYTQNDVDPASSDKDRSPTASALPANGEAGLAWVREANSNGSIEVWFAVTKPLMLDRFKLDPFSIYDAEGITPISSSNVNYLYPAVAALAEDNTYLVAWSHIVSGNPELQQLYLAKVDGAGNVTSASVFQTEGTLVGVSLEAAPAAWSVDALLTFVDLTTSSINLYYVGVNGVALSGSPTLLSSTVSGSSFSTSLRAVGNKILVAWVDSTVTVEYSDTITYQDRGIKYTFLSNAAGPAPTVYSMMAPNMRQADYASAGANSSGQGILMWSDLSPGQYTYYALINPNNPGAPVTLAQIYRYVSSGSNSPSANGQGLAPFIERHPFFLPAVRR